MKKSRKTALLILALVLAAVLSFMLVKAFLPPRVNCGLSSDKIDLIRSSGLVKIGFANEKSSDVSLDVFFVLPELGGTVLCSTEDLTPNSVLIDLEVSPETMAVLTASEYQVRLDAYVSGTDRLCYSRTLRLAIWDTFDAYASEGINA